MIAIASIATALSAGFSASQAGKAGLISETPNTITEPDFRISGPAQDLNSSPTASLYDPAQQKVLGPTIDLSPLPVEKLGPSGFMSAKNVAAFKESIRQDFASHNIYVDAAYVDAFYAAVSDINTPCGLVPPGMDFPTPPAGWGRA